MMTFRTAAFAALLLLLPQTEAFAPRPESTTQNALVVRQMSNGSDDPTKVWYAGFADKVQNVLTNSPLNEGKKALVRSLAGNYDQAAIQAKINGLIEEKPVLMLSFRT